MGVNADERTRLELGTPEEISCRVGHSGTAVTEALHRKQIRPVIQTGAVVMDGIFKGAGGLVTQQRQRALTDTVRAL